MAGHYQAAQAIEDRLRAMGTAERAEKEKRYLTSSLQHLGATVGQVRREARQAARDSSSHDELVALVEALWAKPVHERRATAVFLLAAKVELVSPYDVDLVERLVREAKTWALVDVLAGDVLGRLLVRHPEAAGAVDAWALDADLWVRRAALLSQRDPLGAGAPFERFASYAQAMLDEREFFIRKAIGWVLRETGKHRPDEVFAWLLPRREAVSCVTMREAIKYLPEEQRSALMTPAR